jgi:metal-responsive CopG/Arc/MetJ family transcriptional regulator
MRTIVDLPKEQLDALSQMGQREQISRAEAVRRAVAAYLREHGSMTATGDEAFGLWNDRKLDTRKYEDKLRKEWEPHAGRP